jgi:hypothetical protein
MRSKFYLLLLTSFIGIFFVSGFALADTSECRTSSPFTVILKNVDGTGAAKLRVEVYQEDYENGDNNKPIVGKKVLTGSTDSAGKWTTNFVPTRDKQYIIKVYETSTDNGDFWYFHQYTSCGGYFEFKQTLPRLNVVLRDYKNNLIKDADISLYALHTDADNNPIADRSYLVSTVRSSAQGKVSYYVSQNIPQLPDKNGSYFLQVKHNNQLFNFPGVRAGNIDVTYEYVLSGVNLTTSLAGGKPLAGAVVNIYKQNSDLSIGNKLYTTKTDTVGKVSFEYPTGIYAFTVVDDFRQESVFNNVVISTSGITNKYLTLNYTKFYLASVAADSKGSSQRNFQIYSLTAGDNNYYYKNKMVGTLGVTAGQDKAVSLAAGPYLLVYKVGNQEYGTAFMATNNEQRVALKIDGGSAINSDDAITLKSVATVATVAPNPAKPIVKAPVKTTKSKFNGYVVAVNGNGGLWYISRDGKRFRLDGGIPAYDIIKSLSVGISNPDLNKIPVGVSAQYGSDTDKDGLSDALELALGTNSEKADSDSDRYSDLKEVQNSFNPLGKGSLKIDKTFANKQKGRLFVQVQSQRQLWYISPRDGKRYFLFDADNIKAALYKIAVSVNWADIAYLSIGN